MNPATPISRDTVIVEGIGTVRLIGAAATMTRWNNWTRIQSVQFEWEDEPQPRAMRLVSESARVDDPVRVTVAGLGVEARIEAFEISTLRVRIGRRLFYSFVRHLVTVELTDPAPLLVNKSLAQS